MIHRLNDWLSHPHFLRYCVMVTGVWHLVLAGITPLTVDEAHYALYASHLALSYFDHPPLVGWLQAVILLISDHELALRSLAMISYALTLWLLHRFTLSLFQLPAANLAVLLFALMPMSFLLGMAVVPETLLMPLVLALFWQAQRTLLNPRLGQWAMLGVLIGLAGLSKYTSVLMAMGLLLMLLFFSARYLLTLGFWLAVTIALVMLFPVLLWNAEHEWISILYQLNHGAPNDPWLWRNLLQSQLSQLLSYSPMVWVGAWWLVLGVWSYRHKDSFQWRLMLILFSLPGLLIFTIASGKEPSLPHWLLFFYVLALPWLANALLSAGKVVRVLTLLNAGYGAVILLSLSLLVMMPQVGALFQPNPAQDIFGWKRAGQEASDLLQPNEQLLIPNWVSASRIAWYARPAPVIVLDHRIDQFDLWFGSAEKGVSGVLLLSPDHASEKWVSQFEQCQWVMKTEEGFQFYRCEKWQDEK